ncbi:MAG: hypothetical protein ACI308_10440 [Muribaculaceae bacterium]
MNKRTRQYLSIIACVIVYYVIHEGAHALYAMCIGAFKSVNFMGIGVQIDIHRQMMSDTQLGVFCLVGALSTLVAGWVMVALRHRICALKPKLPRSMGWYVTIALLMLDPLYLTVFYAWVGGGDMNGIKLLMPEMAVRACFAALAVIHVMVLVRLVYPVYKRSFASDEPSAA